MTTEYDDTLDPDGEPEAEQPKPSDRSEFRRNQRALEERAKERDEAVARADAASRELAFYKAGIDMANPAAKYFVKGYDGDLAEDQVRAAAEEAGLVKAPATATGTDQHPDPGALNPDALADAQGFAALGQATNAPTSSEGINHRTGMEKAAREAMAAGADVPQAVAAYMVKHGLPTTEDDL